MLSIILFILKLIGIILAFIVFLILLVLFIPIRYNIYANYKEDISGEFKVHWLLHFLHFKGIYADENFKMKLRILGLVVFDSDKVPKDKKSKINRKSRRNKNKKDNKKKNDNKQKKDIRTKKNINNIEGDIRPNNDIRVNIDIRSKEDIILKEELKPVDNISIEKNIKIQQEPIAEKVVEKIIVEKDVIKNDLQKEAQNTNIFMDSKDREHESDNKTDYIKLSTDTHEENANNKYNAFFAKVKLIIKKIGNIILIVYNIPKKMIALYQRIGQKFNQIKDKLFNIKKSINRIKNSFEKIKLFLQVEANKDGIKHIFKSLKRILWHIKPKKITGEIEFGTTDPFETGQILAVISMGYGLYGKNFNIYPNFEEEILIGNVKAVGRIRLITLLIIGLKLILYKNNRQLIKNIMVLKEEL